MLHNYDLYILFQCVRLQFKKLETHRLETDQVDHQSKP